MEIGHPGLRIVSLFVTLGLLGVLPILMWVRAKLRLTPASHLIMLTTCLLEVVVGSRVMNRVILSDLCMIL